MTGGRQQKRAEPAIRANSAPARPAESITLGETLTATEPTAGRRRPPAHGVLHACRAGTDGPGRCAYSYGLWRSEDDRQKASAIRFPFIVLVGRPEMAKPGDQMAGGTVGRGRLLASHADREQVIDTLKAAFVQGMLTKDEFDLRVGQTLGSRTYAELAAVTADIPGGPIGAQLPPKRAQAQARAAGNTAVKSGVCTLMTLILAASTSAAVAGPGAALIMALFLMGIGVIIGVIVALLVAGIRVLESRDRKRSSGQLPPRSSPGAGGQASPPGIWRPGRTVPASRSR